MRVIQSVDPTQTGVSSREAFAEIDRRKALESLQDGEELALSAQELIAEHQASSDELPYLPTHAPDIEGTPTWDTTNDLGARVYILGDPDGDEIHVEARINHKGEPVVQFYVSADDGGEPFSSCLFRNPQAAAVFAGNILAAAIEAESIAAAAR